MSLAPTHVRAPPPEAVPYDGARDGEPRVRAMIGWGCWTVGCAPFALMFGLVGPFIALSSLLEGELRMAIMGAAMTALGMVGVAPLAVSIVRARRTALLASRSPVVARPGQSLELVHVLGALDASLFLGARGELVMREHRGMFGAVALRRAVPIEVSGREGDGGAVALACSVRIPDDALPSVAHGGGGRAWHVEVELHRKHLSSTSMRWPVRVDETPLPEAHSAAPARLPGAVGSCPKDGAALSGEAGDAERACPTCRGTLVSAEQLSHLVFEPLGLDREAVATLLATVAVRSPLGCAACGAAPIQRLPLKGTSVEVCAACGACWMDVGERDALARLRSGAG